MNLLKLKQEVSLVGWNVVVNRNYYSVVTTRGRVVWKIQKKCLEILNINYVRGFLDGVR